MSDLLNLAPNAEKVAFKRVVAAARIIDESGALEKVAALREADRATRSPGGRPATVSDRTILVVLLLLALDQQALQLTRAATLVRSRLRNDSLCYLDLKGFDRLTEEQVYHRLARAVQRLLKPLDAFAGPRRKRLTYEQFDALQASRDPEHVHALNDVMHEVFNHLVMSSVLTHGSAMLAAAEGNVAFDGTFVQAGGARGTDNRSGKYVSSEYDAGRYYRDGDHTGTDLGVSRKSAKNKWGYELTLATLVDNVSVGRDGTVSQTEVPRVTLGVAFDGAARQPGRNALRALSAIPRHGRPVNLAIGDRAYFAGAKVENFHGAVADLGFKAVTDYKNDQLGIQDSYRGAIQVEGWWYCPCMPEGLISATADHRDGRIDDETYAKRIVARRQYAATRKARTSVDGSTRWAHPVDIAHRCDATPRLPTCSARRSRCPCRVRLGRNSLRNSSSARPSGRPCTACATASKAPMLASRTARRTTWPTSPAVESVGALRSSSWPRSS